MNDVQMLQEADVSVGIAGAEGAYACANADTSVPALKYLPRLFYHGCQQHYGGVVLVNYAIYKNGVIVFVNLMYNIFVCKFSATIALDSFALMLYNLTVAVAGIVC